MIHDDIIVTAIKVQKLQIFDDFGREWGQIFLLLCFEINASRLGHSLRLISMNSGMSTI